MQSLDAVIAAMPPGQPLLAAQARPGAAEAVLRAMFTEASVLGGGRVMVPVPGLHVLLGGTPGPAARLLGLLDDLPGITATALPGADSLLAWLSSQTAPRAGRRVTLFADASGRLRAQLLTMPSPSGSTGPRWVLAALEASQALLRPGLPLVLACPAEHGLEEARSPSRSADSPLAPVAALPMAALAQPRRFALQMAMLRQGGWRPALIAPAAECLAWMPDGALWHLAPSGPPPASLPRGEQLLLLGGRPSWAPAAAWHAVEAA